MLFAADWTLMVSKMDSCATPLGHGYLDDSTESGDVQWREHYAGLAYRARQEEARRRTHAHTWVPCSGMMVKHTCSSLSFTQASGPSELRDAASSGKGGQVNPRPLPRKHLAAHL